MKIEKQKGKSSFCLTETHFKGEICNDIDIIADDCFLHAKYLAMSGCFSDEATRGNMVMQ